MSFNTTFNSLVRKPIVKLDHYYEEKVNTTNGYPILDRLINLVPAALALSGYKWIGGNNFSSTLIKYGAIYLGSQLGVTTLKHYSEKKLSDGYIKDASSLVLGTFDLLNDSFLQGALWCGLADIDSTSLQASISYTTNFVTIPGLIKTFEKDLNIFLFGGQYETNTGLSSLKEASTAFLSCYLAELVTASLEKGIPKTIHIKNNNGEEVEAAPNPLFKSLLNAGLNSTFENFLKIPIEGQKFAHGEFNSQFVRSFLDKFIVNFASNIFNTSLPGKDIMNNTKILTSVTVAKKLINAIDNFTYDPDCGLENFDDINDISEF
jgi:hypothetical protein